MLCILNARQTTPPSPQAASKGTVNKKEEDLRKADHILDDARDLLRQQKALAAGLSLGQGQHHKQSEIHLQASLNNAIDDAATDYTQEGGRATWDAC
jgi:hypothetical protein